MVATHSSAACAPQPTRRGGLSVLGTWSGRVLSQEEVLVIASAASEVASAAWRPERGTPAVRILQHLQAQSGADFGRAMALNDHGRRLMREFLDVLGQSRRPLTRAQADAVVELVLREGVVARCRQCGSAIAYATSSFCRACGQSAHAPPSSGASGGSAQREAGGDQWREAVRTAEALLDAVPWRAWGAWILWGLAAVVAVVVVGLLFFTPAIFITVPMAIIGWLIRKDSD